MRALIDISIADLMLHRYGFQRALEQAGRGNPPVSSPVGADAVHRAREYAHWVDVGARYHPVRARCLHRSLVLHRWLRSERLPSELRLGVRKEHGDLKAHAWVELGGQVVNDEPAAISFFTPLAPHVDS